MSSKSVFRFKLHHNKAEKIEKIVKQYLTENSFKRTDNGLAWSKELTSYKMIYPLGLEYSLNNDELEIKAYTFDVDYSNTRYIHSILNNTASGLFHYKDLKTKLFRKLEENDVTLINKTIEKQNNSKEFNSIQIILIFTLILIIFTIVCAAILLK